MEPIFFSGGRRRSDTALSSSNKSDPLLTNEEKAHIDPRLKKVASTDDLKEIGQLPNAQKFLRKQKEKLPFIWRRSMSESSDLLLDSPDSSDTSSLPSPGLFISPANSPQKKPR